MMENLWLMATALGIDFHIVSSLAGDSAGDQIKHVLGIPENLNIAFSVRLGYLSAPLQPGAYHPSANAQTPEQVAAALADLIDHPWAELYTNPGQAEMVARYYANIDAFEQNMGR